MKNLLYIVFLLLGFSVHGQAWRDSLNVARDAYKKQDYAKALRYYESAQKKAPENVDLSDEMAQSAYKAREFEKAEKIYQQSSASKKSKSDKAKSYHNMGNARMKKKDYQGAVESYKESLRNNPNDEQTRYNLSEAIRRLKDEQKKNQNDNKDKDKQDPRDNKDNQGNSKDKQNGGNKPKDNKGNNNKQNNSGKKDQQDQNGQGKSSNLPNKSVERMLDKLMKAEAETKRKMGGSKQEGSSTKSGKDW